MTGSGKHGEKTDHNRSEQAEAVQSVVPIDVEVKDERELAKGEPGSHDGVGNQVAQWVAEKADRVDKGEDNGLVRLSHSLAARD